MEETSDEFKVTSCIRNEVRNLIGECLEFNGIFRHGKTALSEAFVLIVNGTLIILWDEAIA